MTSKSLCARQFRSCLHFIRPLLILLGAVCIWLLISYCVEFARGWRLEPTGDALFDRYARAVRNRYVPWLYYSPPGSWIGAPHIPDSVLASWEPEFGNDPRYWQLRYFNALPFDPPSIVSTYALIPTGDSKQLEQAVLHGCADETVWMLLYACRQDSWREQIREAVYTEREQRRTLAQGAVVETKSQAEQRIARQRKDFHEQMAEALPDSPLPRYLQAEQAARMGQQAEAQAELAAGNKLPPGAWPWTPFPASYVAQRIREGKPAGNRALAAFIYTREQMFAVAQPLNSSGFQNYVKRAAAEGDGVALRELHRYICRCAQLDHSFTSATALCSTLRLTTAQVLHHWPRKLDDATIRDMLRIRDLATEEADNSRLAGRVFDARIRFLPITSDWVHPVGVISPARWAETSFDALAELERGTAGASYGITQLESLAQAYPVAED